MTSDMGSEGTTAKSKRGNRGLYSMETRTCDHCGSPVSRPRYHFRSEQTYCNKSCSRKHRSVLERPPVRIEGDLVFISLTKDLWAKVERNDYESIPILKENWNADTPKGSRTPYAMRHEGRQYVLMHRVIMNAPEDIEVNHRNWDGLDNTRDNLELCTRQENARYNRKQRDRKGKPTSSRYKGVSYHKRLRKWLVTVDGKYGGVYADEKQAALAYNVAAEKQFGRFAQLNEIDDTVEDIES